MSAFYCKLNAPRPTFLQDMSPDEAAIMKEHAVYWRGFSFDVMPMPMGIVRN